MALPITEWEYSNPYLLATQHLISKLPWQRGRWPAKQTASPWCQALSARPANLVTSCPRSLSVTMVLLSPAWPYRRQISSLKLNQDGHAIVSALFIKWNFVNDGECKTVSPIGSVFLFRRRKYHGKPRIAMDITGLKMGLLSKEQADTTVSHGNSSYKGAFGNPRVANVFKNPCFDYRITWSSKYTHGILFFCVAAVKSEAIFAVKKTLAK